MSEVLHDFDLTGDLAEVLRLQLTLVHNLDRHLGLGQTVRAESDNGKVACAKKGQRQYMVALRNKVERKKFAPSNVAHISGK